MILVTGAAGKTGRAVVAALAARGAAVRAWVRRSEQVAELKGAGAAEVVVGELGQQELGQQELGQQELGQQELGVCAQALRHITKVYHICPNMSLHEVANGRLLIAAAQKAGVAHVVYHSVLHPQAEKMPHHWAKLRVEELLFESGMATTILQPTAYMQNLLAGWPKIVAEGVYAVPYPPETKISLVDLADIAEVAARVLTEPGHEGATYELVGTVGLTPTAVAHTLSQQLNRSVQAVEIPLDTWQADAEAAGLSAYAVNTLRQMFVYYAHYGLLGNPTVLTHLLGRAPTTLAAFGQRVASG